jgi:hypothetical protein
MSVPANPPEKEKPKRKSFGGQHYIPFPALHKALFQ